MWELYAMWAWIGIFLNSAFLSQGRTDASRQAALWTFGVIGIGAVGCAAAGALADRAGRIRSTVLMMGLSGSCALVIGWLRTGPMWLLLAVALLWGFTIVADSAQFSTIVTEVADQAYVGTALTLQLALGFTLTMATIWLIPIAVNHAGWPAAFGFLAVGPALGIVSMLVLRRSDDVALGPVADRGVGSQGKAP